MRMMRRITRPALLAISVIYKMRRNNKKHSKTEEQIFVSKKKLLKD